MKEVFFSDLVHEVCLELRDLVSLKRRAVRISQFGALDDGEAKQERRRVIIKLVVGREGRKVVESNGPMEDWEDSVCENDRFEGDLLRRAFIGRNRTASSAWHTRPLPPHHLLRPPAHVHSQRSSSRSSSSFQSVTPTRDTSALRPSALHEA